MAAKTAENGMSDRFPKTVADDRSTFQRRFVKSFQALVVEPEYRAALHKALHKADKN